jgi:hypothetical protein
MDRNGFKQFYRKAALLPSSAYHKDLKMAYRNFKAGGSNLILDNVIGDVPDLQVYFDKLRKKIKPETEILISYHNAAWEPVLDLASTLGFRKKVGIQNWLDQDDLKNILNLSGFEVAGSQKRFHGITTITIAKPIPQKNNAKRKYSISIIVPARNEAGNIKRIVSSLPKFGSQQEIVFVEGNSKDNTRLEIEKEVKRKHKKYVTVKFYLQKGKGKADAVKLGFEKATRDILMIYDADRTVAASDLPKFYNALANGKGSFINGSRLVYPMEVDAMRALNKFGNKLSGQFFTWILGQRFKDTLCGTKVIWRRDFIKYKKDYNRYLKIDPFGDFALIFTAIKHNLKVIEIPVRYKERVYGKTNINRFHHGLLLFKMAFQAFIEFKT